MYRLSNFFCSLYEHI